MRFAGIDIASETHVVAVVDEDGDGPWSKPTAFAEDAAGYEKLLALLGAPPSCSSPWRRPATTGRTCSPCWPRAAISVALLNPLRTHRFAERGPRSAPRPTRSTPWASPASPPQKRPAATRLPDAATEELRELVRLRDRLVQDFGDRVRQLHRLVDLGFPEFTRYVARPRQRARHRHPARVPDRRGLPRRLGQASRRPALRRPPPRRPRARRHAHRRRPSARSATITARPTACRSATPARTSTSCAAACATSTATSRASCGEHEVGTLLTTIDGIGPQDRRPPHRRARRSRPTSAAPAPSPPTSASSRPQAVGQTHAAPAPRSPPSATPACAPPSGCRP